MELVWVTDERVFLLGFWLACLFFSSANDACHFFILLRLVREPLNSFSFPFGPIRIRIYLLEPQVIIVLLQRN